MKIGLSTLLFPQSSPEKGIRLANDLDLDCIEIIFDIPHFFPESNLEKVRELKERIDSSGLRTRVHGRFWDLNPISQYSELRAMTQEQEKESIKACNILEGDVVTIHPGRCWVRDNEKLFQKCKNWFIEYLDNLAEYAREKGVSLGLETGSHPADYPSIPEELLDVVQDRDEVGITLDIGHVFLHAQERGLGTDWIVGLIEMFDDELVNVHLHDNHGQRDEHLPLNHGSIDFDLILKALSEHYDDTLVLELWDLSDSTEDVKESVEYLRNF